MNNAGKPKLDAKDITVLDSYKLPLKMRDRFNLKLKEIGKNKSEVLRQFIKMFLNEEIEL